MIQQRASSNSSGGGVYIARQDYVIYRNPRHVFPPKFVNVLKNIVTASTATGVSVNQAWTNVNVGALDDQFNSTQPLSVAVGSNGFAATFRNGTLANQSSDGNATMSLIYGYYKVLHVRLVIRFTPAATVDPLLITVAAQSQSVAQSGVLTPSSANAQPNFNSLVVQAGQNNRGSKNNELVMDIPYHLILGMNKQQYHDASPTLANVAPATVIGAICAINCFPLTGAALAAPLGIELHLEQVVEWTGPTDVT